MTTPFPGSDPDYRFFSFRFSAFPFLLDSLRLSLSTTRSVPNQNRRIKFLIREVINLQSSRTSLGANLWKTFPKRETKQKEKDTTAMILKTAGEVRTEWPTVFNPIRVAKIEGFTFW
jgi:hypothetical protein